MHEIITLQCGNRANYLATHFWNVQESYFTYATPLDPNPEPSLVDHDVHFRPGIGADGRTDTYTPRTLIYDYQANFGGLKRLNALYDDVQPGEIIRGLWDGIQQTQTTAPVEPIPYQVNLESGLPTVQLRASEVRYWSDFNRVYYHPRSVVPISAQGSASTLNAADLWSTGLHLFNEIDRENDILDRDVRLFAEESDSLSAFQLFASVDDSWGGYAARFVEALREEYGKTSVWVWAVEGELQRTDRNRRYQRLANSARSLRSMTQSASAYIRLSSSPDALPAYVHLDSGSEWSTSALLCAAVESVALPTRLRGAQSASVGLYEDVFGMNGRQNVWMLSARVRPTEQTGGQAAGQTGGQTAGQTAGQTVGRNGSNQAARDARMRHDHDDTEPEPEPGVFDIDFSPTPPALPTTFPSLVNNNNRSPRHSSSHIFAQIESHRHLPSSSSSLQHSTSLSDLINHRLSSSEPTQPILSVYHTLLPFPLLDSYPNTLFSSSKTTLLVDAALSTQSRTKNDIFALRDLIVGRHALGRNSVGIDDEEEKEEMYDDLTRLGREYDYGWEDEMDLEGSQSGSEGE